MLSLKMEEMPLTDNDEAEKESVESRNAEVEAKIEDVPKVPKQARDISSIDVGDNRERKKTNQIKINEEKQIEDGKKTVDEKVSLVDESSTNRSVDRISTLPPELITRIFTNCDSIKTIVAFASTSKFVSERWKADSKEFLWEMRHAIMPNFDYALMAVRATNIVKAAVAKKQLPPSPFPFEQLFVSHAKPTLEEVKEMIGLDCLRRCLMYLYQHGTWESPENQYDLPRSAPKPQFPRTDDKEGWERYNRRFGRGFYRSCVISAVLYRVYNQPFLDLYTEDPGLYEILVLAQEEDRAATSQINPYILPPIYYELTQHFQKYEAYNWGHRPETEKGRWRDQKWSAILDPFMKWFVKDAALIAKYDKLEQENVREIHGSTTTIDQAEIELCITLSVLVMMRGHVWTPDCTMSLNWADEADEHPRDTPWIRPDDMSSSRHVSIVFGGDFRLGDVIVPRAFEEVKTAILCQTPVNPYSCHPTAGRPLDPILISFQLRNYNTVHLAIPPLDLSSFHFMSRRPGCQYEAFGLMLTKYLGVDVGFMFEDPDQIMFWSEKGLTYWTKQWPKGIWPHGTIRMNC